MNGDKDSCDEHYECLGDIVVLMDIVVSRRYVAPLLTLSPISIFI